MIALLSLASVSAEDKGAPAITFAEKSWNFGYIPERGGQVSHTFTFTNTGTAPLVILEARSSCGCTKPTFTARPIEPGQKGEISVSFAPRGNSGEFTKSVNVKTNDPKNKKIVLHIKGVVIPSEK